jgi:mono/diheme cytochrome c family protein
MHRASKLQQFSKLIFVVLIFVVAATLLWAGNEGKGKYYFKQNCKQCHTKGAAGGEITPMSKTQAQWKSYFTAAKHNKRVEPLTKVMPEEQLHDVQTFLVNHAADSLQPETCGK